MGTGLRLLLPPRLRPPRKAPAAVGGWDSGGGEPALTRLCLPIPTEERRAREWPLDITDLPEGHLEDWLEKRAKRLSSAPSSRYRPPACPPPVLSPPGAGPPPARPGLKLSNLHELPRPRHRTGTPAPPAELPEGSPPWTSMPHTQSSLWCGFMGQGLAGPRTAGWAVQGMRPSLRHRQRGQVRLLAFSVFPSRESLGYFTIDFHSFSPLFYICAKFLSLPLEKIQQMLGPSLPPGPGIYVLHRRLLQPVGGPPESSALPLHPHFSLGVS